MRRWLWIVPILAVLLSSIVFFYWGLSWESTSAIALIMAALATIIWKALRIRELPPPFEIGREET